MQYDIAGLGNAIVDVLVRIPDDRVLADLRLDRGLMHPVDHGRWSEVYQRVQEFGSEVHPGGSCANTIAALGLSGLKVVFAGQVGHDQFGALYRDRMEKACGTSALTVAMNANTGKCLSLISTSDAERTLVTHLGAATELPDVNAFADTIRSSRLLHVTGYLFLGGPMADSAGQALDIARGAGVPISLDVADPFVIHTVRDRMWEVVRDYASLVFLNAEEARALTGLEPADAVHRIAEVVPTVVVKLGSKGSLVKHHGDVHHIGIHPVQAVDTTGAGDAYAAGFLYGWVRGWAPQHCGDLGARFASLAVAQVGAVCRDVDALRRAVHAVAPGAV